MPYTVGDRVRSHRLEVALPGREGARVTSYKRYAFIDESGTDAPFSGSRFLVVSLLTSAGQRNLARIIRWAFKQFGSSLPGGEMKASASQPAVRMEILRSLAKLDIEVVAAVVDKSSILRGPQEAGALYRLALLHVLQEALERHPVLECCIDRPYTKQTRLEGIEREARASLAGLSSGLKIVWGDSSQRGELQAVDYVAWAFHAAYEFEDESYYRLIAKRVVFEDLITEPLW
jgi:hypothetical protein